MSFNRIGAVAVFLTLACAMTTRAQQLQTDEYSPVLKEASPGVWHLMRYAGVLQESAGEPRPSVAGVTFSFYEEQEGGAALWIETHNVQVDGQGHYSALLGGTQTEGLPAELFRSGKARWLGIQVAGQPEEVRVPLASVPYAAQAGGAETLGGRSAADYALSEQIQQVRDGLRAAGFDLAGGEADSKGLGRKAIPSDPGSNANPRAVTLEDLNIKLDATLKNLGATTSDANTKLDTTLTTLAATNTKLDAEFTEVDAEFTEVDATLATTNTKLDTALTRLDTTLTKLDLILGILNTPDPPDPVFSFQLCTEPAGVFALAGTHDFKVNLEGEGRIGAEGFGNGVMARLRALPNAGIGASLGFNWDFLKLGVCADLRAAIQRLGANSAAKPSGMASLSADAGAAVADSGAAVTSNLLDKIAGLNQDEFLEKMLGTADTLQLDPSKLQALLDTVANLSFDAGPFAALSRNSDQMAMMEVLPIPPNVRTVLEGPGQLFEKFAELRNICGISPRPPVLENFLGEVCNLVAGEPFGPMLRGMKGTINDINGAVGTIKNKIEDICGNTIFC